MWLRVNVNISVNGNYRIPATDFVGSPSCCLGSCQDTEIGVRNILFPSSGENNYGYLCFGVLGGTQGSVLTLYILVSETLGFSSSLLTIVFSFPSLVGEWGGEARAGPRRLASARTKNGALTAVNHLISCYFPSAGKKRETQ